MPRLDAASYDASPDGTRFAVVRADAIARLWLALRADG